MSIIISKRGQPAQKLDRAEFEKEDYLQNYIHENPESIPVYEIAEDKRLLVVCREFPTESGPIDALAIDKDGDLYIVETKLYKNPDKRTVVAQALDYGASLWKHLNDFNEFLSRVDKEVQAKFKMSFEEKVKSFFSIEQEDYQMLLENVSSKLKEGNMKFVILMDSMDERLKDLIIYVNQNSQFDIYAVQLEYYKFQEYEIMIPKIFGVEVKKSIKGSSSGGQRRKWTQDDFLKEAREKTDAKTYSLIDGLLNFSNQNSDKVTFGTGNSGVMSVKLNTPGGEITPYRLESKGTLIFGLDYVLYQKEKVSQSKVYAFIDELKKIKGADARDGVNFEQCEIHFDLNSGAGQKEVEMLKEKITHFIKEIKG